MCSEIPRAIGRTRFAEGGIVSDPRESEKIKISIISTLAVGDLSESTTSTAEFPRGTGAQEIEATIAELRRVHRERMEVPAPVNHYTCHVNVPDSDTFRKVTESVRRDMGGGPSQTRGGCL
jgi:hypothetical protein